MGSKRIHRKIERTPEQKKRLAEIRARFQLERPGLQELLASGDATEIVAHGENLDALVIRATSRSSEDEL